MPDVAFITMGDTRRMPAPTGSDTRGGAPAFNPDETRSQVYARYARAVVGSAGQVIAASSRQDALDRLRRWRGGTGAIGNVYFIGHGGGNFAFAVEVAGTGAGQTMRMAAGAEFPSPMRRLNERQVTFTGDATSLLLLQEIAAGMSASTALHHFEVRACYLDRRTVEGYAAKLLRSRRSLHVQVTGYANYDALIEQGNDRWRSEIQREDPSRRDGWITLRRAAGTQAPRAEYAYCVHDGQLARDFCQ